MVRSLKNLNPEGLRFRLNHLAVKGLSEHDSPYRTPETLNPQRGGPFGLEDQNMRKTLSNPLPHVQSSSLSTPPLRNDQYAI